MARSSAHLDQCAIVQRKRVAMGEICGLRQIEQKRLTAIGLENDAPLMAIGARERDGVEHLALMVGATNDGRCASHCS